jgi:L-threonylcarbamoyladenylate synthase
VCRALDPRVHKNFEAKERPLSDPLIVHLSELEWLERLAIPNSLAIRLAERFWPGPLTMVLPRSDLVPEIVTSGQSTVALRMSAHPVFRRVAQVYGNPVAAPSANRFGRISPTTAAHVMTELEGRILDHRRRTLYPWARIDNLACSRPRCGNFATWTDHGGNIV